MNNTILICDGSPAAVELGNLILDYRAKQLAEMIRQIKADRTTIELQNEFYQKSNDPLKKGQ